MTNAIAQIIEAHLMSDNIVIDQSSRFETPEGFLDVNANLSRTGIYEYQAGELGFTDVDPAQVIRVLRTADEVFDPVSMASFEKMPVTDEHPPAMIDSGNNRFFNVGFSGERVVKDGGNTTTKLRITDKRAVDRIKEGKVELSCGYKADIVIESGTDPDFGAFDAIQKNIVGNHIAIVECGRAGDKCKIQDRKTFLDNQKTGDKTMKLLVDGITIDVTEQGKEAIEKLNRKLTDSETVLSDAEKDHKTEIEKMTTDHKAATDKLQGELDAAKKAELSDEDLDKKVAERAALVDSAKKIIKDFKAEGKSNVDIKKEVVKVKHSDIDLDGKSDDYIDAYFDGITKQFSKGNDNLDNIDLSDKDTDLDDQGEDILEKKRAKLMEDNKTSWQNNSQKKA